MSDRPRIVAVVVTHRPQRHDLSALLAALRGQVEHIVLVDNGSGAACLAWLRGLCDTGVHLLALDENLGVAAAHNRGIAWARERGATHVLQLDQDSVPDADMVAQLLKAEARLKAAGKRIAALGPRFFDPKLGATPSFFRRVGFRLRPQLCAGADELVEADYLITSGSLIPISAIDAVGRLDEGLFIDYVDIEWGLRAKAKGLTCYGVCAAYMTHDLGDSAMVLAGKRRITLRSPLRHFYLFRNALLLYRRDYIDWHWKVNDFLRLLLRLGVFSLCAQPRGQHLRFMALGLWHGLRGQAGRLDVSG